MSSDNYWKNWNAQQSAGKGYRPDTRGLTHDQQNEANRIYQEYQKQQEEQRKKNNQAYADLISGASSSSPSSGYSAGDSSYAGEGNGWGSLFVIGLVVFLLYKFDFSCNTSSFNYGYSSATPSTGTLSIASQIMIYPSNRESAIGELKYGITSDSIQWLLDKGKTKVPDRLSWSTARMIYLKNIPSRWVKMYKGRKPVKSGWFLVPQLSNFISVDTATYRKIREKNFRTTGTRIKK